MRDSNDLLKQALNAIDTCHRDPNNRLDFNWELMTRARDAISAHLHDVELMAPLDVTASPYLDAIKSVRTVCISDDREMIFRDAAEQAIQRTADSATGGLTW